MHHHTAFGRVQTQPWSKEKGHKSMGTEVQYPKSCLAGSCMELLTRRCCFRNSGKPLETLLRLDPEARKLEGPKHWKQCWRGPRIGTWHLFKLQACGAFVLPTVVSNMNVQLQKVDLGGGLHRSAQHFSQSRKVTSPKKSASCLQSED